MNGGIWDNARTRNFLFVFIDVHQEEKLALSEMRADIPFNSTFIFQHDSDFHA
jgi:hypothetical protein